MSTVFISSVVTGFEAYRAAARKAVELLGHRPVMSETFGARAHSSETACITEVQQSDVYVLILGPSYGYVTEEGISVTHAEYRAAKESSRPILAFVRDVEMELDQQAFKQEVQAYQSGQFRQSFTSPEELKDGIVQALSTWQKSAEAMPAEEFDGVVDEALAHAFGGFGHSYDPRVALSYLPQPPRHPDISAVERDRDDIFQRLCVAGLASLSDGYEREDGRHWAGLSSGKLQFAVFEDGLSALMVAPRYDRDDSWGNSFLPPALIRDAALGLFGFLPIGAGFFSLRLMNMDHAFVADNPGGDTLHMRTAFGGDESEYRTARFFNPLSRGAFEDWLSKSMKVIERRFGYPPRSP